MDNTSFCGIGTGMVQPTLIFTEVLVVLGFSPARFGVTILRASLFLLVNQAPFLSSRVEGHNITWYLILVEKKKTN